MPQAQSIQIGPHRLHKVHSTRSDRHRNLVTSSAAVTTACVNPCAPVFVDLIFAHLKALATLLISHIGAPAELGLVNPKAIVLQNNARISPTVRTPALHGHTCGAEGATKLSACMCSTVNGFKVRDVACTDGRQSWRYCTGIGKMCGLHGVSVVQHSEGDAAQCG